MRFFLGWGLLGIRGMAGLWDGVEVGYGRFRGCTAEHGVGRQGGRLLAVFPGGSGGATVRDGATSVDVAARGVYTGDREETR